MDIDSQERESEKRNSLQESLKNPKTPAGDKGASKGEGPKKGPTPRSQARIEREAQQNVRSELPLAAQAADVVKNFEVDPKDKAIAIGTGYDALSKVLECLPNLSRNGLATVISTAQTLIRAPGLNARMAAQESLLARDGHPPALRMKGEGKGKAKQKGGDQKTSPKSKWSQLDRAQRELLQNHPVLASLGAQSSKLHGDLSKSEKALMRSCSNEQEVEEAFAELPDSTTKIAKVKQIATSACDSGPPPFRPSCGKKERAGGKKNKINNCENKARPYNLQTALVWKNGFHETSENTLEFMGAPGSSCAFMAVSGLHLFLLGCLVAWLFV